MGNSKHVQITFPHDGDILNKMDGRRTERGLLIEVTGFCTAGSEVRINGRKAEMQGTTFKAPILIVGEMTRIRACTGPGLDDPHHEIKALWDRNCFKRYRYSTDDNIWFLRDLAQHSDTYKSLFDNPYLALWKRLRDAYGTSVQHNIYWQDEAEFTLPQMPEKYKAEWRDNADWLKLAFHARANEPAYPYQAATYAQTARDYENIIGEIVRFAGEEVLTGYTTIHWGRSTRDACRALRDRGIRGLSCPYPDKWSIDPAIAYYLDDSIIAHAMTRDYWWDAAEDLLFITYDLCCNHGQAADYPALLAKRAANPHHSQLMEVMIHEQYFYPHYSHHLPDYAERVETCIRWLTENGYKSVQHDEGFLGA